MNKLAPTQSAPAPGTVRIELLAAKMAVIQNLEEPGIAKQISDRPELREMLFYIQWVSTQPGGLPKFVSDLLEQFPHRIGTPTMVAAHGRKYTFEEKLCVWYELPKKDRPELVENWETNGLMAALVSDGTPHERVDWEGNELREVQRLLKQYDAAFFSELCRHAARKELPIYLSALCNDPRKSLICETPRRCSNDGKASRLFHTETWYFDDITSAVLEMMKIHAEQVLKTLAQTAVALKVFDALDYALAENCSVRIEGDSRFGKTQSIETWTGLRPGLARLVNVPASNTLIDLLRKVADAYGISYTYKTSQNELKAKVEYVIQHSRLFLVFDECAFLVPQTYSKTTAPVRLNWVRTEIIDRHLPFAAVVTPQAFHGAVKQFVRATGYVMEQFLGRTLLTVPLPSELEEKDLIAVARIHFPEMDDDHLGLIAAQAMLSENYLMAVEAIAKRARYIARREKHRAITLSDLDTAISEVIPPASPAPASEPVRKAAPARSSSRQESRIDAPLRRVKTPIKSPRGGAVETLFSSRSLPSSDSASMRSEAVAAAS